MLIYNVDYNKICPGLLKMKITKEAPKAITSVQMVSSNRYVMTVYGTVTKDKIDVIIKDFC